MNLLDILGRIGFDWQVALANLVNFLIIFWILKRYAFKPLQKVIDERQAKINAGLDSAKLAETEALMASKNAEKIILEARQKANEVVAEGKKSADAIIEKATLKAESEYNLIIDRSKKDTDLMLKEAEAKFKAEMAHLITSGATRVIKEGLNKSEEEEITKKMVTKVAEIYS